MVGTGEQEQTLNKLVTALGLKKEVEFLGFLSHDDLAACYQQWSFVVFAHLMSRWD